MIQNNFYYTEGISIYHDLDICFSSIAFEKVGSVGRQKENTKK